MVQGGGINLRLLICAVNGRFVSFAPARAWLNAGCFAMGARRAGQQFTKEHELRLQRNVFV